MRRAWLVLIFIIFTLVSLLPDFPTQARPTLTVPRGTPRQRLAPTPIPQATAIVDIGQLIGDSEEERSSLAGGFSTSGEQLALDENKEVVDQEVSIVHYPLSTVHSVLPMFAMQDEEVVFSVKVSHDGRSDDTDSEDQEALVAHDVVVSQELPASLIIVRVERPQDVGYRSGITPEGRAFFQFSWPTLAPGDTVSAQITLRVARDAPEGAALSFLSVTQAKNGVPETSVVRIGTPPTELPDFEDW